MSVDQEKMTKALDLFLRGRPVKDAMLDAGYEESYAAKYHRDWLGFPTVKEALEALVGFSSGISRPRWQTMMQECAELSVENKEISRKDWLKAMELVGGGLGLTRKDSSSHPTVPINIHIHREDVVIEGGGKVVS